MPLACWWSQPPEWVTNPDQVFPDLLTLFTRHGDRLTKFGRSLDVLPDGLAAQAGAFRSLLERVTSFQVRQDTAIFPTLVHAGRMPEIRPSVHHALAVITLSFGTITRDQAGGA